MEVLLHSFEFLLGYAAITLAYYFNHRFLFHKTAPRWLPKFIRKIHKRYANLHILHHKHAWPEDGQVEQYIRVPLFGKVLLGALALGVGYFSIFAASGVATFYCVYGVRHGIIHGISQVGIKPLDETSGHYRHHMLHHQNGNWHKFNFSGVHPWVDKIFGTYKES